MRASNAIVSIGLLALAFGLSPAVSFDGTRTPEGATVGVPLPEAGSGLNPGVDNLRSATPPAAVPVPPAAIPQRPVTPLTPVEAFRSGTGDFPAPLRIYKGPEGEFAVPVDPRTISPRQGRTDQAISQRENAERREIRVQVSLNLFFAGPTGESEDAVKLRDRVRRSIYEMVAGECTLVEQVLAKTCRLESANISISRQPGGQIEGYMAGGNFVLRVTLK
jgi:hypothetical protein